MNTATIAHWSDFIHIQIIVYYWKFFVTYPFSDIQLRHGPSCQPSSWGRNNNGLWKVSRFFVSLVLDTFQGVVGAQREQCLEKRHEISWLTILVFGYVLCIVQWRDCLTCWFLANGIVGAGAWSSLPFLVHIHIHTAIVVFRLFRAPFGKRQHPVINPLVSSTSLWKKKSCISGGLYWAKRYLSQILFELIQYNNR